MSFNETQVISYEDARRAREVMDHFQIGAGVKPGDDENGIPLLSNPFAPWMPPLPILPGIYLPPWEGGPAGFPSPNLPGVTLDKPKLFLHFRFKNGAEGMNIGLIVDKFKRYPSAPNYVVDVLRKEADELAKLQGH